MEVRADDRWLHSGQQHLFTPFRETRQFVRLSPMSLAPNGELTLRAVVERLTFVDWVDFTVDAQNRFISAEPRIRDLPNMPGRPTPGPAGPVETHFDRLPQRWFVMPQARVWTIVPVVRTAQLRIGGRWTDTLSFAASDSGYSQTLSGVRTSVVVGDTTVLGTHMWIVADSLTGTATERFLEDELSVDASVTIEQSVSGFVRGRYIYDPTIRLARQRRDTTAMTGTATLRYADGRSFPTPVRFDRRTEYTLHAPSAYSARIAELGQNPEVSTDRVANSATGGLGARLAGGDQRLADSLVAAWERSKNPIERQRLRNANGPGNDRGGAPIWARIDSLARQAGDSILIRAELMSRPAQWDVALVRDVLIPSMAEPGGAFARGYPRDTFYRTVLRLMLDKPPAITLDTASWGLQPEIFDYLAEQGRAASDPRLRDLGVVSLFVRDPRRYADSVRARTRAGSVITADAALLADGVGNAQPWHERTEPPQSGASWREWYRWMGPVPPGMVNRIPPPRTPLLSRLVVRDRLMPFSDFHARAVRISQLVSGRPLIAELQRNVSAAADDSARLVYSTILQGLGELPVDAGAIAERFRTGSATDFSLARNAVRDLFANVSRTTSVAESGVDSATRVLVIGMFMSTIFRADGGFVTVEEKRGVAAPPRVLIPPLNDGTGSVFVVDSMPAAVVSGWRSRAAFIRRDEWNGQDPNEGRQIITIGNPVRVGPFIRMSASWTVFVNSSGVRRGGGGNATLFLLEVGGEWVIVYGMGGVS
jgi:hypothetical protein